MSFGRHDGCSGGGQVEDGKHESTSGVSRNYCLTGSPNPDDRLSRIVTKLNDPLNH
jgi:hypothetical protein